MRFLPLSALDTHHMKSHPCAPLRAAVLAGLFGLLGTAAHAFGDDTRGFYIDGGHARHGEKGDTNSVSVGMTVPWSFNERRPGSPFSSYLDFYISNWHARPLDDGPRNFVQIGAIYTLRYRFGDGASPWFAEGGVGATLMDHVYRTPDRSFSTAFQFTEVLGIGRSFGDNGAHEVSLRVQHVSNGGIKKPNPGETFLRLRYTYHF
jgi:lipid A 3-O-deacylase